MGWFIGYTVFFGLTAAIGISMKEAGRRTNNGRRSHSPLPFIGAVVVVGSLFLFVVCLGLDSVKQVKANEVGVPVTFGKIGSDLESGIHVVEPWTDVETLPTRAKTVTTEVSVRTADSGTVTLQVSTRWKTTDGKELYQQARTGKDEDIEKDIISVNLKGAANEFYGGLTNENAIAGQQWKTNATGVQSSAATTLASYGISIEQTKILKATPDEQTDAAIKQVAAQKQKTKLASEAKNTAIEDAKTQRAIAEGQKQAASQYKDLSPTELDGLCMAATERIASAYTAKGLSSYITACGGSASTFAK